MTVLPGRLYQIRLRWNDAGGCDARFAELGLARLRGRSSGRVLMVLVHVTLKIEPTRTEAQVDAAGPACSSASNARCQP